MIIKIPLLTRPKKNSQNIVTRYGKPIIIQSERYKEFEKACGYYLKPLKIDKPINLKCTFYVPDRRKRDLANLLNAIQDVLVKHKTITDDNYNVVRSVDGSRIIYEKGREETIIEIEEEICQKNTMDGN